MNIILRLKKEIINMIKNIFNLSFDNIKNINVLLNVDKDKEFGDLSCNAAMVLSKELEDKPREIAKKISDYISNKDNFPFNSLIKKYIKSVQIAGPGFLNMNLNDCIFSDIAKELFLRKEDCFKLGKDEKKIKFLIEFVSANPTGPLHIGHGRNGIIGDVLANVLNFLGHSATREFYINDLGSQIIKLGQSFKVRCKQQLGINEELPEDGYKGEYLINLAKECIKDHGKKLLENDDEFFSDYAKNKILEIQKKDLADYGIIFDKWFSEKELHESGAIQEALELLKNKDLAYEKDGALWFRSTQFGDDKDRVIRKSTGEFTYITPDIAYHKNKFERGFDKLIDVLGQDHHGYITRLKATIQALGFDSQNLKVILYQMVSLKHEGIEVRMSKRAGRFTTLKEVINTVGKDVARFFYLNRKAEAHLTFDLSIALKKTEENPVFYIQYAYVRTRGIFQNAEQKEELKDFVKDLLKNKLSDEEFECISNSFGKAEFNLIKKLIGLDDVLCNISQSYQTHLLSYYVYEMVHSFHNYYTNNRIINVQNVELTKSRLLLVFLVRMVLQISFDLLGISKLEKM
ncbi:arginine--tRNA ligase [Candidatus Babeliales bacterium]|nr:arginine--tRNA ligase [Candidatus Babeliales bacterium]